MLKSEQIKGISQIFIWRPQNFAPNSSLTRLLYQAEKWPIYSPKIYRLLLCLLHQEALDYDVMATS